MSGVESWAMIEPSMNSTIECTTLCGCTTTSTRSISIPNSQRASIISRPLLNSVAESIVIFRPITQEGCLSARSTVIFGNSSFGVLRKGPPDGRDWFAFEALENSGVFAVHREDFHIVLRSFAHDDFAGHHQDFLGGD